MNRKILFILFFVVSVAYVNAQVKIGENPEDIHGNSILELDSNNKALVITRMSTAQMNAITPLAGAMVYNTTRNCIYTFNGTVWKSLCSVIDKGNGTPIINSTTTAGDVYVDASTGTIYTFNGTTWIKNNKANANNGLTVDNATNTVQLGGTLTKPTTITTTATNTLTIKGLPNGDITKDEVVTVDSTTGQFKKIQTTNLFREEERITIAANNGDRQFPTAVPISDAKKVNVYRNGVRISFTVVDNNTIEVEPEAVCYKNDKIRVVQFY